jgi:hypothetical protein
VVIPTYDTGADRGCDALDLGVGHCHGADMGLGMGHGPADMKHRPPISEEEFNKRHDLALRDSDTTYKKKTKPKPKRDMFKGLGGKSIT